MGPRTKARAARILELHSEGLSNAQIAARIGLSRSKIGQTIRAYHLKSNENEPAGVIIPGKQSKSSRKCYFDLD